MSSIAPRTNKLARTNNKVKVPISPMPNTTTNRHFVVPAEYEGVDDSEQLQTCTLTSRYKLHKIWVDSKSDLRTIVYKHNFKITAHRFFRKHSTFIRVQNLPFYTPNNHDVPNSAATLCSMLATAIIAMIDDAKAKSCADATTPTYFSQVVDVRLSATDEHYLEFEITHIGDEYLPLDYNMDKRLYYPVLMDRTGLHHATTDASHAAMATYTEAFSKEGKKGRMMMPREHRHYLADGLPSKCLNIQVVGWFSGE